MSAISEGRAAARSFASRGAGAGGQVSIKFFSAELNRLLESPEGPVAKDLVRRALRAQRTAKRLCPVDTGRLRSSISWRLQRDSRGLFAVVGTDVEYALHIEFGTRPKLGPGSSTGHVHAQPFLRPALMEATRG